MIVLIDIHLMKIPTATYTNIRYTPKMSIILNVNGFAILEHSRGTVVLKRKTRFFQSKHLQSFLCLFRRQFQRTSLYYCQSHQPYLCDSSYPLCYEWLHTLSYYRLCSQSIRCKCVATWNYWIFHQISLKAQNLFRNPSVPHIHSMGNAIQHWRKIW